MKQLFILIIASFLTPCDTPAIEVKVGQTWKAVYNDDNPYEVIVINYREVIDISGDYVLYIQNEKDTLNKQIYWFVCCDNECIKNCE